MPRQCWALARMLLCLQHAARILLFFIYAIISPPAARKSVGVIVWINIDIIALHSLAEWAVRLLDSYSYKMFVVVFFFWYFSHTQVFTYILHIGVANDVRLLVTPHSICATLLHYLQHIAAIAWSCWLCATKAQSSFVAFVFVLAIAVRCVVGVNVSKLIYRI